MDPETYITVINIILVTAVAYYRHTRRRRLRRSRRWGVRPIFQKRDRLGEYLNLFQEMKTGDPEMFFKYTRMTSATFDALLNLVEDKLKKKCRTTKVISPGQRLALVLRYLATGDSMQSTGWSYRVTKTTVHKIIKETCQVLCRQMQNGFYSRDILHPVYLRPPSTAEWRSYAEGFSRTWNLPNCCGAMDGKHIVMQAPKNAGSLYFNYKQSHSLVLFAVCDHNYIFRYVDIGCYGSTSDGGVLSNCQFGQALEQEILNLPAPHILPNSNIVFPHYFVGDEAFPLRVNLLRPFPGKNLTNERKIFNYRLSRARRIIENSFGILASRWRIFRRPIIAEPSTVEGIVKACICLHNFLKLSNVDAGMYCPRGLIDNEGPNREINLGDWRQEITDNCAMRRVGRLGANNFRGDARQNRDILARYLNSPNGSVEWQNEMINRGRNPM